MRHHTKDPIIRANHIATHEANVQYKKYGPEIDYIKLWLFVYYSAVFEFTGIKSSWLVENVWEFPGIKNSWLNNA